MVSIKVKDLCDLHFTYRAFFIQIVNALSYDLRPSLLVMAFLLWLEERNNHLLVLKLLAKPIEDAKATIREAQCCINCLVSESISDCHGDFTSHGVFPHLGISLPSLYQTKYTTISGIKRYVKTHCSRIFSDILFEILYGSSKPLPYQPLHVPGFPDPIFGNVNFTFWQRNHMFDTQEFIWSWHALYVDEDDRSLYLTFSHGFPVSEVEVKEVFTSRFGDCVEIVDMPRLRRNRQILFARVVMRYVETIDLILRGSSTAKFKIKGKHVWAKKYRFRRHNM